MPLTKLGEPVPESSSEPVSQAHPHALEPSPSQGRTQQVAARMRDPRSAARSRHHAGARRADRLTAPPRGHARVFAFSPWSPAARAARRLAGDPTDAGRPPPRGEERGAHLRLGRARRAARPSRRDRGAAPRASVPPARRVPRAQAGPRPSAGRAARAPRAATRPAAPRRRPPCRQRGLARGPCGCDLRSGRSRRLGCADPAAAARLRALPRRHALTGLLLPGSPAVALQALLAVVVLVTLLVGGRGSRAANGRS